MDLGEVFGKAWKIIWNNKVLWIFGILASCSGRSGGGGGGGSGSGGSGNGPNFNGPFGSEIERFMNSVGEFLRDLPVWVYLAFAVALLALFLLILFLSTMGRIGLIKGTLQADRGAARLSLGRLWNDSLPYFWRVFLLNLLIMVMIIIVIVVAVFIALGATVLTLGVGLICLIPLICLMIPAFWLFGIIIEQANVAVVADDVDVLESLNRAWKMFKANLGNLVVVGLILAIAGFIIGLIIAIPFVAALLPLIPAFINGQSGQAVLSGLTASLVIALIYLPIAVLLNGILQAYVGAVWTLTYRRLTTARPAPVITVSPAPPPPEPELPTGAASF